MRPVLMRLDLFCKQISLAFSIFDRNKSDCRGKNYISVENYNTTCGDQILVLFIVLKVLFHIYIPNWILNSSSFLKYLAVTLQTNDSNLSPLF